MACPTKRGGRNESD